MLIRKITVCLMASLTWIANAYAGIEDWKATFTVQGQDGHAYTITHTPSKVHFLFFTSGGCLYLGQGTRLNDLRIPEDMKLCTHENIEAFKNEVQKLGLIIDEAIEVGPTYEGADQ